MKSLKNIFTFEEFINEASTTGPENYMVFGNLEKIKKNVEILLAMDPMKIDSTIKDGHDWAEDHISVANENLDQVTEFFTSMKESAINEDSPAASKEEKAKSLRLADLKMKENIIKLMQKMKDKPEDADVFKAEIDVIQAKQTVAALQKKLTNLKERKANAVKF